MDPRLEEQLKANFCVKRVTAEEQRECEVMALAYGRLAELIAQRVPAGRPQSLALTNLEQSMYWAVGGMTGGK